MITLCYIMCWCIKLSKNTQISSSAEWIQKRIFILVSQPRPRGNLILSLFYLGLYLFSYRTPRIFSHFNNFCCHFIYLLLIVCLPSASIIQCLLSVRNKRNLLMTLDQQRNLWKKRGSSSIDWLRKGCGNWSIEAVASTKIITVLGFTRKHTM